MQDTLLRVFVVTLSLMRLWDDPGIEEGDNIILQKQEEWLLREREKLDQEIAPVNQEMTHTDDKGPLDDVINVNKEQNEASVSKEFDQRVTEKDKMPDVTDTNQDSEEDDEHFMDNNNSSLPEKSKTDTDQKDILQVEGSLQLDMNNDVFSSKQQEAPLSHHTKTSDNETSENALSDWEKDYLWYIWNTLSIISLIRFFRKCLRRNPQMKQEDARNFPVPLPDSNTLQRFYSKCIQVSLDEKCREGEFLEGFVADLLESMRSICDRNGGMLMEDFQMVDVCDIIVTFTPPEPYSFQCLLSNNQATDLLPDRQVCGQIKLVENKKIPNGCPCQSSDADDDMVCLLHCENERVKTKIMDVCDGPLCMKNSPFLSKSQVTRWFQSTIRQAWTLISHKYEFELNIRYIDAPGALVVRFRSGKRICFSLNPVVKFNSDAHFYITPYLPSSLDTFWTLSLTIYEDRFLEHISKRLPENSCHIQTLDIARFLHKRQTALSGSSSLKDFHFKTALMHLLLTKDPSHWKPDNVACTLQDLLAFIQRSLEKRLLHHVLIGNPLNQRVIQLPTELTHVKPVNLFHPLVVHNCIYKNAVMHFQETLRNADMLIHDYVKCIDRANCAI
ncbi:inositol 1,4,5-trisphosphate receptor-interacting protein [Thunnus maccoyii]|uniref:inositol 1,4,5-trisphosphate receptor-interacting protein n=1 Tax=Thunnus maccoyii TaxID=8240 RepID=UPI001C4B535E|nr:inositol 1,4,5-trisphosphate receptor-interacting protein [Thunnus maccoyii]XP_042288587.1 inositol 1,4,5-trisphosphate receptor-interacting protein [Thunnus maccoyii]XP_042288596.1 inositol 1,4,5-trisphosphate receptor-interacting protein [Thunnus maccoyii]XP_042288603.1 inositol 1,4,5-trisphosphate receptor-interacting protein [Thunnus maccoyii]